MEGFEISATFEAATLHELHHLPHRKLVTRSLLRSDRFYRLLSSRLVLDVFVSLRKLV